MYYHKICLTVIGDEEIGAKVKTPGVLARRVSLKSSLI